MENCAANTGLLNNPSRHKESGLAIPQRTLRRFYLLVDSLMTKDTGPTPAQVMTEILNQQYSIRKTPDGKPFVVANAVPSVMTGMDRLAGELRVEYYMKTGRIAPTQAVNEVTATAEALSSQSRTVTPSLRLASYGSLLYLDLGRPDGWAVEISASGWRVVSAPPVVFMRTAMTSELPLPAERGSADRLRSLINIADNDEWALYIACRIASLIPGITHPVEVYTGPAGSAKTWTMRISSEWIDPSVVMIPVPRDGRTWATMAAASYVLPVDNISYIPGWWSDLLCKAASGDGWMDRALYTDGDIYVSRFQSVVMLNGITLGSLRGDLADRMVMHKLARPQRYTDEITLQRIWDECHPEALAWLLDQTVAVLRAWLSAGGTPGTHRLAHFEQVVELVDRIWHTRAAEAWRSGRKDVAQDVVESDLIATAVQSAITMPTQMSSAELTAHLQMHGGLPELPGRPWTPRLLSEHLDRAVTPLGALGWSIRRYRVPGGNRKRVWEVIPPGWAWDGRQWTFPVHPDQPLDRV